MRTVFSNRGRHLPAALALLCLLAGARQFGFGFLRARTRQVALDYHHTRPAFQLAAAVYAKDEWSVVSTRLLGLEVFAERTFTTHLRPDISVAAIRAGQQRFDEQNPDALALARAAKRFNLPFILKGNLRLAGKFGELGAAAQYRAGAPFTPILGAAPGSRCRNSPRNSTRPLCPPISAPTLRPASS